MAERNARRESVRAGATVTVGAVALLPIERTVILTRAGHGHAGCWATKALVAVVIRDAQRLRAVDANGDDVTLDVVRTQWPECRDLECLLPPVAGAGK